MHTSVKPIKEIEQLLSTYLLPEEIEKSVFLIQEIRKLKQENNVVVLGHNYMSPDIFYGVSDFTGDSLALSQYAVKTDAEIILFNGVHFMAETAKILNPAKMVLLPDMDAGCSLAEAVTAQEVTQFKMLNPDIPVVTYINSTAEVKSVTDIVCTSANAVKVVESLSQDTVLLIPDSYLAMNVQKQTKKKILSWNGKCMVHELFSETDIMLARKNFPGVKVIAHPECKPEVTENSDFTGSTSQIEKYIEKNHPEKVLLLTECSMGDNIKSNQTNIQFVSTCQMCPHMKKITLQKIYDSLLNKQFEINVDPEVSRKANIALSRMLDIGR